MHILWGTVVAVLSLVAWGGQLVSWLALRARTRITPTGSDGFAEQPSWIGIHSGAPFDSVTLWTMVVAGVLLIVGSGAWAYFGLVGGGMYVYFAGRELFTRIGAGYEGGTDGGPRQDRLAYVMLVLWAVMGLVTIAAAVAALPTR